MAQTKRPKPKASQYHTDAGMHAAMKLWAASQRKPSLVVEATFSDSPEPYRDRFDRAQVEVQYKTRDGHTYCELVDGPKYVCWLEDEGVTATELKRKVEAWLKDGLMRGVTVQRIKWTRADV